MKDGNNVSIEQNAAKAIALEKMVPKVYVQVNADFRQDGAMLPREIVWENGRKYAVDRIIDIRQASAAKAGGQGDRYTVQVRGQQSYLFFERSANQTGNVIGRWFVEQRGV